MSAMGGVLEAERTIGEERRSGVGQAAPDWSVRLMRRQVSHLTVLVVDDNQGLIDLFRRYLAGSRWEVVSARNGAEARAAAAQAAPSAIILDVMMPDEDGWEVLMSLRRTLAPAEVPVIVCSVLNARPLAQALGAGYLAKPVTRQALRQALAALVQDSASPATAS